MAKFCYNCDIFWSYFCTVEKNVLNEYSKKGTLYKVNETVMFTQMVQFSPFNRIHLGSFKKLSTYVFPAFSTLLPLKTLREIFE